jgi:hypothetical protein
MMDPQMLARSPELMATMIPILIEWEVKGLLTLVRDADGKPVAVENLDVEGLRAEIERLRTEQP